eukprot:TRINITY_DN12286_c0_g1_i1.p1 TRINITY_DN12286_c0_g1~~TRINITY_DN12286_c0_g1_i1.p1  ORF type:complete len:686 (-),score=176.26 TRINITY_DN12286_c0_g1_i1:50-2107(-)
MSKQLKRVASKKKLNHLLINKDSNRSLEEDLDDPNHSINEKFNVLDIHRSSLSRIAKTIGKIEKVNEDMFVLKYMLSKDLSGYSQVIHSHMPDSDFGTYLDEFASFQQITISMQSSLINELKKMRVNLTDYINEELKPVLNQKKIWEDESSNKGKKKKNKEQTIDPDELEQQLVDANKHAINLLVDRLGRYVDKCSDEYHNYLETYPEETKVMYDIRKTFRTMEINPNLDEHTAKIVSGYDTFGISLDHLFLRENSDLPKLVDDLCTYLEDHCLNTRELFIKSIPVEEMGKYKDMVNKHQNIFEDPDMESHLAANLLVLFLSELPDPVGTYDMHQIWMSIKEENQIEEIREVLLTLPKINFNTLKRIMHTCHQLFLNSKKNRLSTTHVARILAPNLIRSKEYQPMNMMRHMALVIELVAVMIEQYPQLFDEIEYQISRLDTEDEESPLSRLHTRESFKKTLKKRKTAKKDDIPATPENINFEDIGKLLHDLELNKPVLPVPPEVNDEISEEPLNATEEQLPDSPSGSSKKVDVRMFYGKSSSTSSSSEEVLLSPVKPKVIEPKDEATLIKAKLDMMKLDFSSSSSDEFVVIPSTPGRFPVNSLNSAGNMLSKNRKVEPEFDQASSSAESVDVSSEDPLDSINSIVGSIEQYMDMLPDEEKKGIEEDIKSVKEGNSGLAESDQMGS